jgi:hypothetical protein
VTTAEILARLNRVRKGGIAGYWSAECPAHQDGRNSLTIRERDDGTTLLRCHAGCQNTKIVTALGLKMADLFRNGAKNGTSAAHHVITLHEFATAKHLPAEFLRDCGVVEDDGGRGLTITYRHRDGTPAARQRRRTAIMAKEGSWWAGPKDTPPIAYGVWRLDDALDKGELLLVEGETDTLTAWLHNRPALGIPGADMVKTLEAEYLAEIPRLYVLQEPDKGGATFVTRIAARLSELGWAGEALVVRLPVKDLNALHTAAGAEFAETLSLALAEAVPLAVAASTIVAASEAASGIGELTLQREGLDLVLVCPGDVRFTLTAIRDGREGIRGELTVTQGGRRLSWSAFSLLSIQARETLRKKLDGMAPDVPWGPYLEEVAWRFTQAAREGEPLVTLTGRPTSSTRELMPRLLYEGEPTLLYADGDTGKSLVALALAVAVQSGASLPCGLKAIRPGPVVYLDWETSCDTLESRLALLANGLGIDPPPIIYKHMTRPLVDEASALAAEFARRRITFVIVDSMMFAVSGSDGAAFHEPITGFYNALRLFAPAASLVLNHVTGADARGGGPARPFGGAFAFNGPRLIWEAKRDHDVTDATAIAFTSTKANNLARKPDPFGLRFVPGQDAITVYPFDLAEAAPQTVASASLPYRIRLVLADGQKKAADLAERLDAKLETVRRTLGRLKDKGTVRLLDGDEWELIGQ